MLHSFPVLFEHVSAELLTVAIEVAAAMADGTYWDDDGITYTDAAAPADPAHWE
jgi:hypothetical protein